MCIRGEPLDVSDCNWNRVGVARSCFRWFGWACLVLSTLPAANALASEITLLTSRRDSAYTVPRPAFNQQAVPLRASFYLELAVKDGENTDVVLGNSVEVSLKPAGHAVSKILGKNVHFVSGYHGFVRPSTDRRHGQKLVVYIDSNRELLPATDYTIDVTARSRDGAQLSLDSGTWKFTTAARPVTLPVAFTLPLNTPAVRWHGGFFTGVCGVTFGGNHANRLTTYELMDDVRETSPRAWSLQRDFWLTGMEHEPKLLTILPNIVRERETRRVLSVDRRAAGTVLTVGDFFGHAQYGISSDRPLSGDYRVGDEVLLADSLHNVRAQILSLDDSEKTVTVSNFDEPEGGWKIAYTGPLPKTENPNAPGLFPRGGTYLQKFSPCGVPAYYWGRLDHEWDLAHRRFGRRLIVNFADAPGDLSIDGRNWTTAKDYAELHEVVRTISGHIIDRYGEATLSFPWSVFNEPNLGPLFWRSDWNELQKFYDYTTDAILRAFEDRGYDSQRVFIGGFELAGGFASQKQLRLLLAHCSPNANAPGAVPLNAAYADPRLNGKRSARVEKLCRANGGRGAPCDFISIHAYKSSQAMAAALVSAKETALAVDAERFSDLAVNSHESCPGWQPLPDPAFGDSYLGNGYFVTWCADVARRQLQRAAEDRRFGYGESILTYWPGPNQNFGGPNDVVREILVDDDGDGRKDRSVTVAMPVLHLLGLMAQLGDEYHVLPERIVEGHVVSGFASQAGETVRILLYAHNGLDTESRSDAEFEITVDLEGLGKGSVFVREYRFDKTHNSCFQLARSLRDAPEPRESEPNGVTMEKIQSAIKMLGSDSTEAQLAGLEQLAQLGPTAKSALGAIFQHIKQSDSERLRTAALIAVQRIKVPKAYPTAVAREVERLSHLKETNAARHATTRQGRLKLPARVSANGVNYLVIEPN